MAVEDIVVYYTLIYHPASLLHDRKILSVSFTISSSPKLSKCVRFALYKKRQM